jgi:hypothetical protein
MGDLLRLRSRRQATWRKLRGREAGRRYTSGDLEPDRGLGLDHPAGRRVGEEFPDLRPGAPLDDERLVEVGVAHLDVLQAEEPAEVVQDALAVDREPEPLGVDVGARMRV